MDIEGLNIAEITLKGKALLRDLGNVNPQREVFVVICGHLHVNEYDQTIFVVDAIAQIED